MIENPLKNPNYVIPLRGDAQIQKPKKSQKFLHMLNNFCFYVYAKKLPSYTLTLSHKSHSRIHSLGMLNNFCFHV